MTLSRRARRVLAVCVAIGAALLLAAVALPIALLLAGEVPEADCLRDAADGLWGSGILPLDQSARAVLEEAARAPEEWTRQAARMLSSRPSDE